MTRSDLHRRALKAGDRIAVKFSADPAVMGYFMGYYNDDYVTCTLDDFDYRGDLFTVERRRVSKAPTDPPPVANIQILEATMGARNAVNKRLISTIDKGQKPAPKEA